MGVVVPVIEENPPVVGIEEVSKDVTDPEVVMRVSEVAVVISEVADDQGCVEELLGGILQSSQP